MEKGQPGHEKAAGDRPGAPRPPALGSAEWLGLKGRRVVVAGVGGIGSVLAAGFVGAGAQVLAVDRDAARLEQVRSELDLDRTGGAVARHDLRSPETCSAVVEAARRAFGGLDVLVHTVGINDRVPIEELGLESWDEIMKVNLSTAFWLAKPAGTAMRRQRSGRMIFLSSVAGTLGHRHHGPYAASKGGLNQLVKVMAVEWADVGITVNAVAPGYIETDLTRDYLATGEHRERLTGLIPAGRLGVVEDLVGPVLFLASDHAAFITGQVLHVDGGRTLV